MDDRTMLELAAKPKCAVRGQLRPLAMCGSVIVGGKYCGYKGSCPHKVEAAEIQLEKESGK